MEQQRKKVKLDKVVLRELEHGDLFSLPLDFLREILLKDGYVGLGKYETYHPKLRSYIRHYKLWRMLFQRDFKEIFDIITEPNGEMKQDIKDWIDIRSANFGNEHTYFKRYYEYLIKFGKSWQIRPVDRQFIRSLALIENSTSSYVLRNTHYYSIGYYERFHFLIIVDVSMGITLKKSPNIIFGLEKVKFYVLAVHPAENVFLVEAREEKRPYIAYDMYIVDMSGQFLRVENSELQFSTDGRFVVDLLGNRVFQLSEEQLLVSNSCNNCGYSRPQYQTETNDIRYYCDSTCQINDI